MANPYGFSQSFTDRPEVWRIDGYVSISDGYGAPSSASQAPVISSISRLDTGKYEIVFREAWYGLLWVDVRSMIASGSPAFAFAQLLSHNVGTSAAPSIIVQFVDGSGSAVELPSGSAFLYSIALKRSSV